MQTYTHAAIGAAIGVTLFPNNITFQGSCAIGATLPDLVMVPQYLIDLAVGRKPMAVQSARLMSIKEMSHSFILWVSAVVLCGTAMRIWPENWLLIASWAVAIGGLSHLSVDILTHTNTRFAREDPGMLWPFETETRLQIGRWDYRKDYGDLTPKPFEALVCCIALLFFVLFNLRP